MQPTPPQPTKKIQLNRLLSKKGICSRTQAEVHIQNEDVLVNNKVVRDPLAWIDSTSTITLVSQKRIPYTNSNQTPTTTAVPAPHAALYAIMNKPSGYVTTRSDELHRQTVYDLLPPDLCATWCFPVGRLDKDSEGLLLFTNDTQWADNLLNPETHVEKIYRVKVDRLPTQEDITRLCAGITLDGTTTKPCTITRDHGSWFLVTLSEGKNRQIRKMFWECGGKVKKLIRVQIGKYKLAEDFLPGTVRVIEKGDI